MNVGQCGIIVGTINAAKVVYKSISLAVAFLECLEQGESSLSVSYELSYTHTCALSPVILSCSLYLCLCALKYCVNLLK